MTPGRGSEDETAQKPTCATSGSLPQMAVQTGMAPSGRSLAASQSPSPVSTQSNSPRQVGLQGPSVCAHSSVHSGTAHRQEGARKPVDSPVSGPGNPLPQATVHGRLTCTVWSEGSPTQGEALAAIPRSGRPRHCTRRQRVVTSKAGRVVAKVEGTGWPFWGLKTPESPSGYAGSRQGHVKVTIRLRQGHPGVPANTCAPLPGQHAFPQRRKESGSSSAWTHRGRAGAESLSVES